MEDSDEQPLIIDGIMTVEGFFFSFYITIELSDSSLGQKNKFFHLLLCLQQ